MHDEGIGDARAQRVTINEADAKLLGRNLAVARQRRGYTQNVLAERAGISRDAVYKIEMGLRSPRIGTLLALADALGLGLGDLLEGLRP
jgi:transcriptional regulator with XRE-family HTH domain